jgi:non-homologous end joining protein Ku
VLLFATEEQVDPIYFNKSYYLEPEAQGTKPYVLLRDALEGSGKVAVVKVALRQRESLATLRVRDGVFVLEMMLWPDEIRQPDFGFLDDDVEVRPAEVQMAQSLIDAGLTVREAEVMRLVAHGASNHDAAEDLGLSERTVAKHLEHVFRKLRVPNRTAAAALLNGH